MKRYKLTLNLISPVHIGTGLDYEPTNYVIDENDKKQPRLYEFNEVDFYRTLTSDLKEEFHRIVNDPSPASRFRLYSFIVKHKAFAKRVSFRNIQVLEKVAEDYKKKIGQVVQKEGGGKNVFNDFHIARTYMSPNLKKAIIPGSSIKGAISTAYQEKLYKKYNNYEQVKNLMLTPGEQNLFRHFKIADTEPIKSGTFIGYAINRKRNRETKAEMKTLLEGISSGSEYVTYISCHEPLYFEEIAQSCNDHYLPIFRSMFDYTTDEETRRALDDDFIQKYEKWSPSSHQFILRVGKHSGARAVTIEGLRSIKIMTGRGKPPRYEEEETTIWLRGGGKKTTYLPFGWIIATYEEQP